MKMKTLGLFFPTDLSHMLMKKTKKMGQSRTGSLEILTGCKMWNGRQIS